MVCTRLICLFLRRAERPPSRNSFDFVERLNIDATIVTKIEISPGTPEAEYIKLLIDFQNFYQKVANDAMAVLIDIG